MMHQEKIPGGKMVCFSLESDGGKARDVRLTGDFFLHPEDTILRIEESLEGIPLDSDESAIGSRIAGALDGAQLIGATPEDLARVFRRAVVS